MLLDQKVETNKVKSFIESSTGRIETEQGINNFRLKYCGFNNDQLLSLIEQDQNNGHNCKIEVNEENLMESLFIQTKEMSEHFANYPEYVMIDGTYSTNISKYPLYFLQVSICL